MNYSILEEKILNNLDCSNGNSPDISIDIGHILVSGVSNNVLNNNNINKIFTLSHCNIENKECIGTSVFEDFEVAFVNVGNNINFNNLECCNTDITKNMNNLTIYYLFSK